MRIWAIERRTRRCCVLCCALACCTLLTGCVDTLLERSYSSTAPHSAVYWENQDADTLRAENYQDLVNALLLLLDEHSEDGLVRIYGDAANKAALASRACLEVQKETPIGAYLLDYITYDGKTESTYYELNVRFGYRRTQAEQEAIVNATSTEALPDLLRTALEDQRAAVAIRFGYFDTDRAGVLALIETVHAECYPHEPESGTDELPPEEPEEPEEPSEPSEDASAEETGEAVEELYDFAPWQVAFYPSEGHPGIVEVRFDTE